MIYLSFTGCNITGSEKLFSAGNLLPFANLPARAKMDLVATLMDEWTREENTGYMVANERLRTRLARVEGDLAHAEAVARRTQHQLHVSNLANAQLRRSNEMCREDLAIEVSQVNFYRAMLAEIFHNFPRVRGLYEELAEQVEDEEMAEEEEDQEIMRELFPDSDVEIVDLRSDSE